MITTDFPEVESMDAAVSFHSMTNGSYQKRTASRYKINYIKLMNGFWNVVPFIKGCRPGYVSLFMAIVDEINRNKWEPTAIPYEHLLSKARCSKQTYLKARAWLHDNRLLHFTSGKNGKQMANYFLGEAVLNWTTDQNPEVQNQPQEEGCFETGTSMLAVQNLPQVAVQNQPHYYKLLNNLNNSKHINRQEFEEFFKMYGLDVGKEDAFEEWTKLSYDERCKIKEHVPKYIAATPVNFRRYPVTYLKKKSFNDQVINRNHSDKQLNNFKTNINTDGPRERF